jgi:hypothetical protein
MRDNLKSIRKQQSLSVEFVSSIIDIEPNLYRQIENGDYPIEKEKTKLICTLLGIESSDLINTDKNVLTLDQDQYDHNNLSSNDLKELEKLMIFGQEIEKNFT